MLLWLYVSFLLGCCVMQASALTAVELAHFDAFYPNVSYSTKYNRKKGVDMLTITSKGWPHYATDEWADVDQNNGLKFKVYEHPEAAGSEGCLKTGPIAVYVNGVPLLNVYTSTGYDAVGVEYTSLDQCGGHSNANGAYHYHGVPWCDDFVSETNPQKDQFIGVAYDGYAIYGPYNSNGDEISRDMLDNCGGETYENDEGVTSYRYRLTREFPYSLGCFSGKALTPLTGQFCVMPYICGDTPANYNSSHPLYEECGGPWPERGRN